jgi:hypothetical protein
MAEAFTDMLSRAEVLAPGFTMPTFDAAAKAVSTFDRMCDFRRNVLRTAWGDADTRGHVKAFLVGDAEPKFHDKATMTCDSVNMIFNGASTLARTARGQTMDAGGGGVVKPRVNGFGKAPPTAAELNLRFAKLRGEV